jgi:hypothetical protein
VVDVFFHLGVLFDHHVFISAADFWPGLTPLLFRQVPGILHIYNEFTEDLLIELHKMFCLGLDSLVEQDD